MEEGKTFRDRFLQVAGSHPYAWAARHNIPKYVISGIVGGNYKPQKKTLEMLNERAGLSVAWLVNGTGSPYTVIGQNGEPMGVKIRESVLSDGLHKQTVYLTPTQDSNQLHIESAEPASRQPDMVAMGKDGSATIYEFKKAPVDKDLMALAVQALDEFTQERGIVVKPDRKGAILAFLYNYLLQDGDIEEAAALLRAVAGE